MESSYDYLFKVLITGNSGVGKSCLLIRYVDDVYVEAHNCTVGLDFRLKLLEHFGKKIKLQLWDTSGQEKYRTITNSYYRGSQAVLLVFDVSQQESFVDLRSWIQQVDTYAKENVCKIIVANKIDNENNRVIDTETAKRFAEEEGADYMEVSAKTGINVEEVFALTAQRLLQNNDDDDSPMARHFAAESKPLKRKSACCAIV